MDRPFAIAIRDVVFRFSLSVPEYIVSALSGRWGLVVDAVRQRGIDLLAAAARAGFIGQGAFEMVAPDVAAYARIRTYEEFQKVQAERGNEAWAVPLSLQPTVNL